MAVATKERKASKGAVKLQPLGDRAHAACQALDCLQVAADHLAALLDWDAAERARQIEAYQREIEPMRRFSRATATAS